MRQRHLNVKISIILQPCAHTLNFLKKISTKSLGRVKKRLYLCNRYPENNLFTLKELIPIEDMKRQPVRVIALFFARTQTLALCAPIATATINYC